MPTYLQKKSSRDGLLLDLVVSSLQKCIRRGLEKEACYWVAELDLSGYGNAAWIRLLVISVEDVGVARFGALGVVVDLYEEWKKHLKQEGLKLSTSSQSERARWCLRRAASELALSAKSRVAATSSVVIAKDYANLPGPVTQEDLDRFGVPSSETDFDPAVLRVWWKWAKEMSGSDRNRLFLVLVRLVKAKNEKKLVDFMSWLELFYFWNFEGEDKSKAPAYAITSVNTHEMMWDVLQALAPPFIDTQFHRRFFFERANERRLFYLTAAFAVLNNPPLPHQLDVAHTELTPDLDFYSTAPDRFRASVRDFAKDKHTLEGKLMGRGLEHFFTEGAHVEREAFPDPFKSRAMEIYLEQEKKVGTKKAKSKHMFAALLESSSSSLSPTSETSKTAGEKRKRDDRGKEEEEESEEKPVKKLQLLPPAVYPKASAYFSNPVRAQKVTHAGGEDVFFATLTSSGRSVFVKGPYKFSSTSGSEHRLKMQLFVDELKAYLPVLFARRTNARVVYLLPDLKIDHQPIRRLLSEPPTQPQPYIVMDDLLGYRDCATVAGEDVNKETGVSTPMKFVDIEGAKTVCAMIRAPIREIYQRAPAVAEETLFTLAFRFALQVSDTQFRNLMVNPKTGEVYSVDEDNCLNRDTEAQKIFKTEMGKADKALFKEVLLREHSRAVMYIRMACDAMRDPQRGVLEHFKKYGFSRKELEETVKRFEMLCDVSEWKKRL